MNVEANKVQARKEMLHSDVVVGDNTVHVISDPRYSDKPRYIPLASRVTDKDGKIVFRFVKENFPASTSSHFLENNGMTYIVITKSVEGKRFLTDVYPVKDMHKYVSVALDPNIGPVYEGRDMRAIDIVNLKKAVASVVTEILRSRVDVCLSKAEKVVEKMADEAEKEIRQGRLNQHNEKVAKASEEKAARKAKALEEKQRIESRKSLRGYSGENKKYFSGTPVVGNEWLKLPGGTFCVEVASYNDEDKTHGEVLGCFIVGQKGTFKNKQKEQSFSFEGSTGKKIDVKPAGEIVFKDLDGDISQVKVYNSIDNIETLRKAGLNSGTIVAVKATGTEDDVFSLYSVTKDKVSHVRSVQAVLL
jgi:hypothetical protein